MTQETSVFFEWTSGIIRGGPGCSQFPAPYDFSCHIVKEGNTAYLMGACGNFNMGIYRAIKVELEKIGIKNVKWERRNNGFREVKIDLF